MFGFLIGAASLIGLIKTVRGGCGGGHRGGWRGRHHGWDGDDSGPVRWILYRLSSRIDASPGQEKVIREALTEVMAAGRALRETVRSSRADVARSIKGEHFDQETLKDLEAKQNAALEELRKAATAALAKVHEALDPKQREILAELIENGPGHRHHGHGHGCGGRGGRGGRWHRWHGESAGYTDAQSV